MKERELKLKPGQVFNFLTIEGYDRNTKRYFCRCICGKQTLVASYILEIGKSKSCGCQRAKLVSNSMHRPNHGAAKNVIFDRYKRDACKRSKTFELSKEDFVKLILGNCHYCGASPANVKNPSKPYKLIDTESFKYNGIDRVDNSLGYNLDNCVSCCIICNRAKNNLLKSEWENWLNELVSFRTKPSE
jgi:5-methylcytosine-specific restriction endonuclease McrA